MHCLQLAFFDHFHEGSSLRNVGKIWKQNLSGWVAHKVAVHRPAWSTRLFTLVSADLIWMSKHLHDDQDRWKLDWFQQIYLHPISILNQFLESCFKVPKLEKLHKSDCQTQFGGALCAGLEVTTVHWSFFNYFKEEVITYNVLFAIVHIRKIS